MATSMDDDSVRFVMIIQRLMATSIVGCVCFVIVRCACISIFKLLFIWDTFLTSQYPIMSDTYLGFRSSFTPGVVSTCCYTAWFHSFVCTVHRLVVCMFMRYVLCLGVCFEMGRPRGDMTIPTDTTIHGSVELREVRGLYLPMRLRGGGGGGSRGDRKSVVCFGK